MALLPITTFLKHFNSHKLIYIKNYLKFYGDALKSKIKIILKIDAVEVESADAC